MLNTKLGFFYVHRYHFLDVKNMVALYEICRYLLYAIIAFGCLSHIIFAHRMLQTNSVMHSASSSALHSELNSQKSVPSHANEGRVTNQQVLLIGHAVIAFVALICLCESPLLYASLAWFAWSLHLCVKGGIR